MANATEDEPELTWEEQELTPKEKKSIYNKKRYQHKKNTEPDFMPRHSKRTRKYKKKKKDMNDHELEVYNRQLERARLKRGLNKANMMPLPPSSDSDDELLDEKYLNQAPVLTKHQQFKQVNRTPLPHSDDDLMPSTGSVLDNSKNSGGATKKGGRRQSKIKNKPVNSMNPPHAPKHKSQSSRSQHAQGTAASLALSDSDLEDEAEHMMTKKFFFRFLPKEAIYESDGTVSTLTLKFTSHHENYSFNTSNPNPGSVREEHIGDDYTPPQTPNGEQINVKSKVNREEKHSSNTTRDQDLAEHERAAVPPGPEHGKHSDHRQQPRRTCNKRVSYADYDSDAAESCVQKSTSPHHHHQSTSPHVHNPEGLPTQPIPSSSKISGSDCCNSDSPWQKQRKWKCFKEAVSATGVVRSVHECEIKLRCYTHEVKHKFCDAERGTYKKSGAGGGTPFKLGQPTQLEELALAYLGIDKVYGFVGGTSTNLFSDTEDESGEKRDKEVARGKELDAHFKKVAKNAARHARRKYLQDDTASQTDDDEGDSIVGGKKRKVTKRVSKPSRDLLERILDTIDRIEDRLIRIETKVDDLADDVATLRVRNLRTRAANLTPKPPTAPVAMLTLAKMKECYAEYIEKASETDLGRLLIKALPSDKARVIRERTYNMLIEGMTDAEYEEFQRFYKKTVPKYFGTCIPDEGQFRIKTAIANDLVANGRIRENVDEAWVQLAQECQILNVVEEKSPVPSIRRSLNEIFNDEGNTDNTTGASSVTKHPTAEGPQPSTSAAGNVLTADLDSNSGTDSQVGSQQSEEPVKNDIGKRVKRKRGGKK